MAEKPTPPTDPAHGVLVTLMANGWYRVECHACGWWEDVLDPVKASALFGLHKRSCTMLGRTFHRKIKPWSATEYGKDGTL